MQIELEKKKKKKRNRSHATEDGTGYYREHC
jgi:hypothetical protein